MQKWLVALLVLLWPALSHGARLDPSFTFSTIETAHFSIHYHEGLEPAARTIAVTAEEVFPVMTAELAWQPREKTQVVLVDNSDFANGLATAVPYNAMYLQVVPPATDSTIGDYDDWLKTLFAHEFAHILTSDPARGYATVMRAIFGKPLPAGDMLSLAAFIAGAPPNIFMPRWWHEGTATWSESRFSGSGRGRSSYYDMIFRAAVADDNLPGIDTINGDVPFWPGGTLPYAFGMRLTRFIADTYGNDAPGRLNTAHSGRFPYAITTPPEDISKGRNYADLYEAMVLDLKREQSARIETLKQKPFTGVTVVSQDGELLTNPRHSPDGSLVAYTRHDPHEHTRLVIREKEGKVVREIPRNASDGSLCWAPDGSKVYFSQAEINNGFNVYQDLYAFDLRRDAVERLTVGLRLRDVEISPDGSHFAAVVTRRGSQNLALLAAGDLETGMPPRLLTEYRLMRVSSPRWAPDGTRIAYTVTDNEGKTGIHIFDIRSGEDRAITSNRFTTAWPVWYRDGRHLLHVSDETGVFNLFVLSLEDGKTYQLSHLPTGALQPDLSPDGSSVIFSLYGSRGFSIASMDAEPARWSPEKSPLLPPVWPTERQIPTAAFAEISLPHPYSPLGTLLPRFWLPTASSDGTGVRIGAFTAGQDVLGYHSYSAQLDYGAKFRRPFYSLHYRNDRLYPSFSVRGYEQPALYADLLRRGDYTELNRGLVIQATVPLNFLESRYRFSTGYHLQDQTALSPLSGGRFNGLPVFQGRRDNIFAGIEFSNDLKYPWSISSEEGRTISLRYRYYGRAVGSEVRSDEYEAAYSEYLPLPVRPLRHHVVRLRMSGAIATGTRTVQQAFQLGGTPSDLNRFPLRGYPSRFESGKYAVTGTVEYRFPIWYSLRGIDTKPIFFDRLHGAAFVDSGTVWDDNHSFRGGRIKTGAGIEARFDMTAGYWLKITPTLGVARGFNHGGENQVYFTINLNL